MRILQVGSRIKSLQLLLPALAIALAGCNSGGGSADNNATTTAGTATNAKAGGKPFTIALVAKSSTNPVFLSARTGAEAKAKELSSQIGRQVVIDWRTPANEDGQKQAQAISEAVNQGDDAVLISCSDAAKVTSAINDAVDKGVPVMTFDSDAAQSKRFAFYGADDVEVGTQVMDALASQMNAKGNVAILAGNQNAPNLQARAQAVHDAAKKYPGIKIVNTFYHPETPQDAAQEVISAMKSNPEINGWAMVGGWPLFTETLLDMSPDKVKIVAVDALPAELAYVDKGIAPVLLAQPTYLWGYTSVGMIVDKVINKKDIPVINKMPLVKVTKENLGNWAHQLADWGFQGVDPKYLAMAKDAGGIVKTQ